MTDLVSFHQQQPTGGDIEFLVRTGLNERLTTHTPDATNLLFGHLMQMFPAVFYQDQVRVMLSPVDLVKLLTMTSSMRFSVQEPTAVSMPPRPMATTPEDAQYQRWIRLPLHAQVAEVSAALALNKTQLAEVLDISRPTIYQWMDEQRVTADDRTESERLMTLLRLMAQAHVSGSTALNARFVKIPLEISGKSLLAVLFEKTWDESLVLATLRKAREVTDSTRRDREAREAHFAALGYEPADPARRDTDLDVTLHLEGLDPN